jgi:hypothetical protein
MHGMTPDLSGLVPFMVVFIALGVAGGLASLAVLGRVGFGFVVDNHRTRVARHETIPTYYRRLLLSH